jgi:glycosyltransferase EpsE
VFYLPKVSIVMGVYNVEKKMLLKVIESIINQTYQDWEFIICDDGSTGKTWSNLLEISKLDNRIKLVRHRSNLGHAAALNNCITLSEGMYIARQDQDDYSDPHRLEKQIEFLDNHPEYSIVGSNINLINDNGIIGSRIFKEKPCEKDFLWNSPFVHPSIMMRKQDLVNAGCYTVSKETRMTEDYELFMRLYAMKMLGYNIQESLYYYYISSVSSNKRKFKYRVDEAVVRYKGFKKLHLMPQGLLFVAKPILVGLIPKKMLFSLKAKGNNKALEIIK